MAGKALNTKNLEALGAGRLAALLIEVADGDAALKRRLRLELAGTMGAAEMARQVRQRLKTLGRAQTFVEGPKRRAFLEDLAEQRRAIDRVAAADPTEGLDLLWRFLAIADVCFQRCDDSDGVLGDLFRDACDALGPVAEAARPDPEALAERAFEAFRDDDFGVLAEIIPVLAPALGERGLAVIKARLDALAAEPVATPPEGEARVIGWSGRGPMLAHEAEEHHRQFVVRFGLQQVADVEGDVDAYIAQVEPERRGVPAFAADIAHRLLAAGRVAEAEAALDAADPEAGDRRPEYRTVRLAVLEALGRHDEAQARRWAAFEAHLDAETLRAHLKRLPDFEDMAAEERALDHVERAGDVHAALSFLMGWPALERAARLVEGRAGELDGNLYWLLGPAAEALAERHPLAASLCLRAMVGFTLDQARSSRYRHAARHIATCAHLAGRIDDFRAVEDHDAWLVRLRAEHPRKHGFWPLVR